MKNLLKNKNNLKLILINFVIIIILPFNLIINEKALQLDLLRFGIFFSYLILFIITTFLSLLIFYILNFLTKKIGKITNKIFLLLISFFFIWIMINGIFLPVVGEHDAFFNLKYSFRLRYLLILKIFIVLILLFIFIKKNLEDKIVTFFSIYLIANLIFIVSSIFLKDNEFENKAKLNLFGKKNLIVLSLDGISGLKITKEIETNDDFKKILKDFKLYNNVTSAWPATVHSINTELNEKVLDMNFDNLKLNILNDKSINTVTYGVYGRFINDKKKTVDRFNYKDYGRSHNVNIFTQKYLFASLGRWGTPYLINFLRPIFYTKYYKYMIDLISFDFNNNNNLFNKDTHTFYNIQSPEFDMIFNETQFDNTIEKSIRMYHFSFSHWPVKINENCTEVKRLTEKMIYHEEIIIKCLVKKIKIFLNNLKNNNVYKNSLIVIKSDHAKPNGHYTRYPHNLKINNTIYWGLGRYKPFILIKDVNNKKEKIEISDKHVFLADLATTYCNFFYEKKYCEEKYKYNNLLLNENSFKKNNYEIYIPQKKYTFIDLNDFKKYMITNDISLEENLKKLGIILN